MNLRHSGRYVLLIALISCIALLSINLNNNTANMIEEKPGRRIIIKDAEKGYVPGSQKFSTDGEHKSTVPAVKDGSLIQLLPPSDPDSPIVLNLLN